jgi:hypothetical protein
MKIKKNGQVVNLTESDLNKIVKHSENLDEGIKSFFRKNVGSKFAGIKGLFSGKGYNVTKFVYQLIGSINELNEELEEKRKEFEKIEEEIYKSNMTSEDWDRLDKHLKMATDIYKYTLNVNKKIVEDLNKITKENVSQKERDEPQEENDESQENSDE